MGRSRLETEIDRIETSYSLGWQRREIDLRKGGSPSALQKKRLTWQAGYMAGRHRKEYRPVIPALGEAEEGILCQVKRPAQATK